MLNSCCNLHSKPSSLFICVLNRLNDETYSAFALQHCIVESQTEQAAPTHSASTHWHYSTHNLLVSTLIHVFRRSTQGSSWRKVYLNENEEVHFHNYADGNTALDWTYLGK